MRVNELMTQNVATCRPDTTLEAAAGIMRGKDCGIVPVTDSDNSLQAVITDRDVAIAAADSGKPLGDLEVKSYANRELTTVNENDDVGAVHQAMRRRKVRRLPVVNEKRQLQGIVSLGDLSRAVAESDDDAARAEHRELTRTLAQISEPTERARGPQTTS